MILVVRSEPQLARTVAAVQRACAMEVVGLGISAPYALEAGDMPVADGVIFTSAAGVRFAGAPPRGVGCWCVGSATAEAARMAGWEILGSGEGDALALAERMVAVEAEGRRWLHVCGAQAEGGWYGVLERSGQAVARQVVYDSRFCEDISGEVVDFLRAENWRATLLMSAGSARHLLSLLERGKIEPKGKVLALSEAVAEVVRVGGFPAVQVAAIPTLEAMLAMLQNEF